MPCKGLYINDYHQEVSHHTEFWHFKRLTRRALSVCQSACHKLPINFCAILLPTLSHVVENHRTVITQ